MRRLGEYLVEDGVLRRAQVESVVVRQRLLASQGRAKRFGQILLDIGLVTVDQLERAVQRQEHDRHQPACT